MNPYTPLEIENIVSGNSNSFPALAITGPRQSGKTTLLQHMFGKTNRFVTFDDPLNRESALTDPKLFLESAGGTGVFCLPVPTNLNSLKILEILWLAVLPCLTCGLST